MKVLRFVGLTLALSAILAGCGESREVTCAERLGAVTCTAETTSSWENFAQSVKPWWDGLPPGLKMLGMLGVGAAGMAMSGDVGKKKPDREREEPDL